MGRGNVQTGRKTQRQAFHCLNKGLSLSNDPDLTKKREKMKKGSWTELRKSVTSWRTDQALNSAGRSVRWLGQLDEFGVVTSSWSDQVRRWTGPTKPCACGKCAKQLESVSGRRGAEDLIGIKSRRRSDRDCWKNDPNMLDLRKKAKQTATGTPERTSKIMAVWLDWVMADPDGSAGKRKNKGPAEPSAAALDGVNPLNTTPIGPETGQNAGEILRVQTNLIDTETRVEDDPLNRNLEQHDEEVAESSNAGSHLALAGGARDKQARRRRHRAAEPSMREVLKALTAMATHIMTLTQGFTPLPRKGRKVKKGSWTELRKSVTSWKNGQAVSWTSSLNLDQLDQLVDSSGPAGPTVGRRSDRDCWKNDPNMVDLREKAKQTATGTPERTSKYKRSSVLVLGPGKGSGLRAGPIMRSDA
ncbi:hypothetical protein F2Q68_00026066 [Brassica cretica]|uniref:Uncharacterized protein n=1 Tax=Brassica cretica TaxID=69181 RepID=A0A8S9IGN9_BRACR|nr:hypothetical protein F2Q68_00026066 [Brassica cretica]